jgi:DNA-binding transcriptional ArsR family regulator
MSEEKKDSIEDELSKIKEEMQELKEMLKTKSKTRDERDWDEDDRPEINFKMGSHLEHDLDDLDFDVDHVDSTLNKYLASVMTGVSENIRRSMEKATRGIQRMEHDITRKAERAAEKELRRSQRQMQKSMKKMHKHANKTRRHRSRYDRVIHMDKLSTEELEDFYEIGTKIVSALSDPRRLKLLKLLEKEPNLQGDLSEQTGVKGGTFKHHMDSLLASKYVYQEKTRGRYLITQLGIEALKLAEMLYRRYKFEDREERSKRESKEDQTVEDTLDDSTKSKTVEDEEIIDLSDSPDTEDGDFENTSEKVDDEF